MKLYIRQVTTIFFVSNSLFLWGCSANNYSLDSYTNKVSNIVRSAQKNNETSTRFRENYHIFSNNRELGYVATNDTYRINIGDRLDIKIFKVPELSSTRRVNSQGNISFPLIGKFHARGLSQDQAEEKLASTLGVKYLQNPQVSISVDNTVNNKITLEGQVKKSGVFPLDGNITFLQSIALAGGLNDMADPTKVILFRKSTAKTYLLNLQDIRAGKARDPYVKADDRIVVARSGARSFIRDASTILGGLVTPLWRLF